MGTICVCDRITKQEIVEDDFWELENDLESIRTISPGDRIVIHFTVDQEMFAKYKQRGPIHGVQFQEFPEPNEPSGSYFEILISFLAICRRHHTYPNWMNEPLKHGFRVYASAVLVEAMSDEGQEIFVSLQKQKNFAGLSGGNSA